MHKKFADRGIRLKLWWKSKGWSKLEFARRMDIWPQNVNKYFYGELDPINLAAKLMQESCDLSWIIEGKIGSQPVARGMVAETTAVYGKKKNDILEGLSEQTRIRMKKLIRLLEAGTDKTDREMLDLIIKTMEEKQKKKGKA